MSFGKVVPAALYKSTSPCNELVQGRDYVFNTYAGRAFSGTLTLGCEPPKSKAYATLTLVKGSKELVLIKSGKHWNT